MPTRELRYRMIAFAKLLAKDPEFLYRTSHRRAPNHPSQALARAYAQVNGLPWPTWRTYSPREETIQTKRNSPPAGFGTYTPAPPYRVFRVIRGGREN